MKSAEDQLPHPAGEARKQPPARRRAMVLAVALLPVAILVIALASFSLRHQPPAPEMAPREIAMVAQGEHFNGTNPPLDLRKGETVAITVENRDPNNSYDFRISKLSVRTGYLHPGESERIVFRPSKAGVFSYGCTLHPGIMEGQVIVREP